MTRLKQRIIRHIQTVGPLPIAEYMLWCLSDPEEGYYQTRNAFGRTGDFITAPEVSQMFGEMIGIWLIKAWEAIGKPGKTHLVELGPGNGTLMQDILRTAKVEPLFRKSLKVHLVENSKSLTQEQRNKVIDQDDMNWHPTIDTLPQDAPILLVANEFLDALPFRQYIKANEAWREHSVTVTPDEELAWTLGTATLPPSSLPDGHTNEPDGAVYEVSTPRESLIDMIAQKLSQAGGVALFIDYGHAQSGFGDTFQAIHKHEYTDPLATPGEADLTSHVDFSPFAEIVERNHCHAFPILTQGEFLLQLGLLERAGALGQKADETTRKRLVSEAERLALPHEMGNLFKTFVFASIPDIWPYNIHEQTRSHN